MYAEKATNPRAKESLKKAFEQSKNKLYVGIQMRLPDQNTLETIINHRDSFNVKLEYYDRVYDEYLNHNNVEGLYIIDWSFGDDFDEIQNDLGI